jgi:phosphoserine phosphatase RsbU/P
MPHKKNKTSALDLDEITIADKKEIRHAMQSGIVDYAPKVKGEIIGKIVSGLHYMYIDTIIEDAAKILTQYEEVPCFGVVDRDRRCKGVVLRKDLFDLLGQQYGRDLYRKKSIEFIMRGVQTFDFNRNLYSVADEIRSMLGERSTLFFNVADYSQKFCGVFSTKDMLMYLSEITTKELDLATRIQSKITKDEVYYETQHFEAVCGSKMAKGIGGDYYFVKEYEPEKWIIAICDVSGKGISASLDGIFSVYDFKNGVPGFIEKINRYLFSTFESEKFVTTVIADFREKDGAVYLYDMGHSLTYLFRKNRLYRLNLENKRSIPLGLSDAISPLPAKISLHGGDVLLFLSDGIEEQVNHEGVLYGQSRIQSVVARNKYAGLTLVKKALFADVRAFRDGYPQHDDITAIILRYKTHD